MAGHHAGDPALDCPKFATDMCRNIDLTLGAYNINHLVSTRPVCFVSSFPFFLLFILLWWFDMMNTVLRGQWFWVLISSFTLCSLSIHLPLLSPPPIIFFAGLSHFMFLSLSSPIHSCFWSNILYITHLFIAHASHIDSANRHSSLCFTAPEMSTLIHNGSTLQVSHLFILSFFFLPWSSTLLVSSTTLPLPFPLQLQLRFQLCFHYIFHLA